MRLISLCLAVCLIFCSVIPVSAAEGYTFDFVSNSGIYLSTSVPFIPVSGQSFIFSFSFPESSGDLIVSEPLSVQFMDLDFQGQPITGFHFTSNVSAGVISGIFGYSSDLGLFALSLPFDDSSVTITVNLIPDSGGAFINPITDTIPVVLGWFGLMLSGITSGSLSVLWSICCVGISVAVVFVVVKIIKRFSWGT